ncbi:MAG: hypothetical protein IRZ11_00900 [Clostridia bacterium]|nr:hypothetical protein [Clostridia bacterium]
MRRPLAVRPAAFALALAVLAAALVPGGSAGAHITGVFLYFLKDVQGQAGQSSLDILKAQLDETDRRIAELAPQVDAARARYEAMLPEARRRVLFYGQYAGEAFLAAVFGGGGPVDALANLQMVREVVGRDLESLRAAEAELAKLEAKERELRGYRDLVAAFVEAERRHREAIAGRSPQEQELALYGISESWEEIRAGPLAAYVRFAERRISGSPGLEGAVTPVAAGRFRLDEAAFQRLVGEPALAGPGGSPIEGVSDLEILLRADHVYVVGTFSVPLGRRQVILVGQFVRAGPTAVRYRVEYALVDGYLVDPDDPQMQEVVADETMLRIEARELDPAARLLQFQQDDGALWLYTRR